MAYGDPLNSTSDDEGRTGTDLLTRMIYSEAGNQTEKGKRGVAFVAKNRKDKNTTEFGGNTWSGVILKVNQFAGMSTSNALKPDTSSSAWEDSLEIAKNISSKTNSIGSCLWFNTNTLYGNQSKTEGGKEYYRFQKGFYNEVTEKTVIGDHTFFKITNVGNPKKESVIIEE